MRWSGGLNSHLGSGFILCMEEVQTISDLFLDSMHLGSGGGGVFWVPALDSPSYTFWAP